MMTKKQLDRLRNMTPEDELNFCKAVDFFRECIVRERELIEKTKKFYADLRSRGIDTSTFKKIVKHRERIAAQ